MAIPLTLFLARRGLKRLHADVHISDWELAIAATIGSSIGLLAVCQSPSGNSVGPSVAAMTPLLCALMTAAAKVDYCSAWAPVELMIPACLLGGMVGLWDSDAPATSVCIGLGSGLLLYLIARLAWVAQSWARTLILPPADTIALLFPILLFGGSIATVLSYVALTCLLVLIRIAGTMHILSGSTRALESAGIGMAGTKGRPITLVAIVFPLLVTGLLVQRQVQLG